MQRHVVLFTRLPKGALEGAQKICGRTQAEGSSSSNIGGSVRGLEKAIDKPFTRLNNKTWLHDLPEQDVFRLLIDAYRMRIEDTFNFDGIREEGSLYDGASDSLVGFQRFLQRTEAHPGLLPPWWNSEKRKQCEELGMDTTQWSNLYRKVKKDDIIEHYGNNLFPMQLRMFGEAVYGQGPGGADGTAMMRQMMMMER